MLGEHVLRNSMNGLTGTTNPDATGTPRWRRLLWAGLAALSIALVLSGPLASQVQAADDDEEESFETKAIKKFFGINNRDSIDYRERSPLVVPPNINSLPQPQANQVVNSPAWPKDPEEVERKKRQQAAKNRRRTTPEEEGRALTPAELDVAGRKPGAGRVVNPTGPQDAEADGRRIMRPDELGTTGSIFGKLFKDNTKPEVAEFRGEPARGNLTEPPTGYRTPSAAHPYGLLPRQEKAKPFDLSKRGEGN
jgi:hypothetical protein